jgi:hypothetical protein
MLLPHTRNRFSGEGGIAVPLRRFACYVPRRRRRAVGRATPRLKPPRRRCSAVWRKPGTRRPVRLLRMIGTPRASRRPEVRAPPPTGRPRPPPPPPPPVEFLCKGPLELNRGIKLLLLKLTPFWKPPLLEGRGLGASTPATREGVQGALKGVSRPARAPSACVRSRLPGVSAECPTNRDPSAARSPTDPSNPYATTTGSTTTATTATGGVLKHRPVADKSVNGHKTLRCRDSARR